MLRSNSHLMSIKRTAKFVVVSAAAAAWLAAAATSGGRRDSEPIVTRTPPIDIRGAALAGEISRLHERLQPVATPREPGRNLFSFGRSKSRQAGPARPIRLAEDAGPISTPTSPAPPPLKLSGIGEDAGPDGVVRTAIISGLDQLFLAKEGESVTLRYRVLRISSDVVELTDLVDGSVLRLALK